jgi:CRISPR-associated protein Cas1
MKNYYVLSNGRVKREANTLYVENENGVKKPLPVEDVESLYLYGEVDLNTKLLTFLSQKKIPLHVFNYYGFYAGSYYPREYLHSGYLLVKQVLAYHDPDRRLTLARELVKAAAHSLLRNVLYYERRKGGISIADERDPSGEIGAAPDFPAIPTDADAEAAVDSAVAEMAVAEMSADEDAIPGAIDPLESTVEFEEPPSPLTELRTVIQGLAILADTQPDVSSLMGIEGKMRERYYQAWRHILSGDWVFQRRVRRPPDNEINALISFGNSMLYTVCLGEIYRTQLTPTISYLHEPGARRFSLALDLSEIFKPLIVDRAIFRLINTGQLDASHFDKSLDSCYLTDSGKRLFLAAIEERLGTTIKHRKLGRHVSYRHLIRLECYKLIRDLTGIETYRAFRAWW